MSKAFTSEETEDAGPLVAPPPVLRPGEKRFITPEGAQALEARLESLRAQRAAVPRTEWTAQERARALDAAVDALTRTLAVLTVAQPPAPDDPHVRLCSRLRVRVLPGAAEREWRVVGPDEADPAAGHISVESPVGRALLGARAGDDVEVDLPRGPQVYRVLDVRQR